MKISFLFGLALLSMGCSSFSKITEKESPSLKWLGLRQKVIERHKEILEIQKAVRVLDEEAGKIATEESAKCQKQGPQWGWGFSDAIGPMCIEVKPPIAPAPAK